MKTIRVIPWWLRIVVCGGCRNLVVLGLALLLCAGCAGARSSGKPTSIPTYSGSVLPDEQAAILLGNMLYSIDGSSKDPAGVNYYGKYRRLSLLPGEHSLLMVIRPDTSLAGDYRTRQTLWYGMQVSLAAGRTYRLDYKFIDDPGVLDRVFNIEKAVTDAVLVLVELETGKRVGKAKFVKSPYD